MFILLLFTGMPMYPMRRKRTDSHGSGNDSQEEPRQELFDREHPRDPRAWSGYPPGPPHMYEDMRRAPFFDQRAYHESYDRNVDEYRR